MSATHNLYSAFHHYMIFAFFIIGFIFNASITWAAPGDSCSNSGATERQGGQTLICDGSTWNLATEIETDGRVKLRINEEADPCTNSIVGQLRFEPVNSAIEYCDGTAWVTTTPKTLESLADVNASSPSAGTVLGWDASAGEWVPVCKNFPDGFAFTNISGATPGSTVQSGIKPITGISCATASISINGQGSPQYRICSDNSCSSVLQTWTASSNTIANGDYVQIRLTASSESLITYTATLTMGSANRSWSVTTPDSGAFKRIFVVNGTFSGAMGGIAGADQICQDRAVANSYAGTFYAWLATDSSDDPESRFTKATVEYRDPDDQVVAYDWASLTSGGLASFFNTMEGGGGESNSFNRWTNVAADGTAKYDGTNNCLNWTSSSNSLMGHVGTGSQTGPQWTDYAVQPCDSGSTRLYCIQQ